MEQYCYRITCSQFLPVIIAYIKLSHGVNTKRKIKQVRNLRNKTKKIEKILQNLILKKINEIQT